MFHKQFCKSWWKWPKGNLPVTESQRTWSTRTFGGGRRGTGWALSVSVSQKTILKENNRPLYIQPKIPEISNATDHVGLVRPENLRPALKVVLFDRSGYLCQLDRNVPLHLSKLLSPWPVPLFCILLSRTITKRAVAGSGLCNRNVPFHWACEISSEISNRDFCWMENVPSLIS